MGIYGALSTAVTGLRAQSFALENISGNIANSQTTAYKKIDTTFIDLIPDAPLRQQVPGAVLANSRSTNTQQGDIASAGTDTFMAINGSGFFVVDKQVGSSDGEALFSGGNFYTRRGDFEQDKQGYLVNGAGYFLKGLKIDPATGNVSGSVPEPIQITNSFLPASPTTKVNYELNLPQVPSIMEAYTADDPDSVLLDTSLINAGDNTVDPVIPDSIPAEDNDAFQDHSIEGGTITMYSASGAPASLTMRWAKTNSVTAGGADTWTLFYQTNANAVASTDPAVEGEAMWAKVGDYEFDATGALTTDIPSVDLQDVMINGVSLGDVTLNHGTNGVTNFADPNGSASASTLNQNGYGAGEFSSVAVNEKGRIVASYTNGEEVELAQVVLANFSAANNLKRLDGGAYAATSESGEPIIDPNGSIVGGALETSNTDISEEFTKLIITQQAYSAGTRIVTTADEMMQEALNMVR